MNKVRLWYKYPLYAQSDVLPDPANIDIRQFMPWKDGYRLPNEHLTLKTLLIRILFSALSKGALKIFYVEEQGQVIHTSYLMPRCWKFPFIKQGDYHIGPCQTIPEYRGRGIYPAVLKEIVKSDKNATYHIVVAESNKASVKGIVKAGFAPAGLLIVTPLKRYKEYRGNE